MSEEIVKTVRCDMCGEVLDLDDEWVVRRHMRLIMQAGIDFLFFDTTNAVI